MSLKQSYMENFNHFGFDELKASGNKVRMQNMMRLKSTMLLAVNNVDRGTKEKVKKVLMSLTIDQRKKFTRYVNEKQFLKPENSRKPEQIVLDRIAKINLTSRPADPYLAKLLDEFNKNVGMIDKLKIKASTTRFYNREMLTDIMCSIERINNRNLQLIDMVNNYRENKNSES